MVRHHATMLRTTSSIFAIAALALLPASVWAQSTAEAKEKGAEPAELEVQEIVVTGSRLSLPGLVSTTPVTSVGAEQIEQRGAVTVGDALIQLPVFAGSISATTANQNFNRTGTGQGNIGAAFLNLRNLGANRTLTLLDSHRLPASGISGQVDANTIPSILVKSMQVVTGGASAAYGSDAVAGVVNILLDHDMEGFKTDLSYGQSHYKDNKQYRGQAAYGTSFAENRGHLILAGEYFDGSGVGDLYTRPWGAKEIQTINNFCYGSNRAGVAAFCPAGGNGLPANLTVPGAHFANQTYGGKIGVTFSNAGIPLTSTFSNIQFLPRGVAGTINYGAYADVNQANNLPTGTQMTGTKDGATFMQKVELVAPNDRYNFFSRASFDVTDRVELFAEGAYGRNDGSIFNPQPRGFAPYQIRVDNAYLPASLRTAMQAAGIGSFNLHRASTDIGHPLVKSRDTYSRFLGGAKAELGEGWDLNAWYQHGVTKQDNSTEGSVISDLFGFSRDAVLDSAGRVVCRATLPSTAANAGSYTAAQRTAAVGCVPVNLFGEGSPSREAINYFTGTQRRKTRLAQDSGEVTLQGTPFALWAGDIAMALGAGYRSDSLKTNVDALSAANRFDFGNAGPVAGTVKVKELFGELEIPLLENMPIIDVFSLNGAVRYTDYSTTGGVTTWKAGATWRPIKDVLLRAARSRDIRAPNIVELFSPQVTGQNFLRIFQDDRNATSLVTQVTGGNLNLKPEVAETDTVGVAYTPSWAPGLNFQADYYNLSLSDAIGTLDSNTRIDRCFAGNTAFCEGLTIGQVSGRTQITSIFIGSININRQTRKGIDFQVNYNFPLSDIDESLPGKIAVSNVVTYTIDSKTITPLATIDYAGTQMADGLPRYRFDTMLTYSTGPSAFTVRVNHIPRVVANNAYVGAEQAGYNVNLVNGINYNHLPARTYVGLNASYDIDTGAGTTQVYANVNNLFNVDPPDWATNNLNYTYYDAIGRMVTVGVRTRF